MKIPALLAVILLFCPCVLAQSNESVFQEPAGSASVSSLIDSLRRSEENIKSMRQDLAETKAQIPRIIDNQIQKLSVILFLFFVSFFCFSKLLGRLYARFMFRRWRSKNERLQESILDKQASILARLEALALNVNSLDYLLKDIKGEASVVLAEKKRKEAGGRSLFSWLKFWRK